MRVAIVNDLPLAVEALKRVVLSDPANQLAWIAMDGYSAIRQCLSDRPDVILMDLVMPGVSGADATREIMKRTPCAILVVTATVTGNFALVNEAMGYGAYDAVETPTLGGNSASVANLLNKLKNVDRINQRLNVTSSVPAAPAKPAFVSPSGPASYAGQVPIVGIGSSTGGPAALEVLLSGLKPTFPAAILIAQHIGEEFAKPLADWLGTRCKIRVSVARSGARPEPGTAYVAVTSDHLIITAEGTLEYTRKPADNPYRPSVDALFNSLVDARVPPRVAVLLTGIGADGAKGMLRLRQAGWYTIAQDEQSCVVYGMPKAAASMDAAVRILPLDRIAANLDFLLANPQPKLR
jgi:two-component system response regulator WspF